MHTTARPLCALALLALASLTLGACGDTLQDQPSPPSVLEPLVTQEAFPVYWLGGSFHGLPITHVGHNPGGAYEIQYGNCLVGGENVCATPLEIVTSPDNSFLPGGAATQSAALVRGVRGRAAQGGRSLSLATGPVVVDLYATTPALVSAAAETMVAINRPGAPGAPLAPPLPNTGYGRRPLPVQQPAIAPAGGAAALRAPAHG
ncbi:MAG TPA: hypothetical protein VNV42_13115 [Solirubrobacteraceae bacterium]|jgi:hypothetical protein|nr:hypothetical protein [Solirubrobacteraceae bacterium]